MSNMQMSTGGNSTLMRSGKCLTSQMLWNWETIDNCLISSQWRITSNAQFAGSCIGIILMAMSLQLLRRLTKEYDARILRDHQRKMENCKPQESKESDLTRRSGSSFSVKMNQLMHSGHDPGRFRPNPIQQLVRALLHMSQFMVAYFIMLYV
jgi:copper transporter 1